MHSGRYGWHNFTCKLHHTCRRMPLSGHWRRICSQPPGAILAPDINIQTYLLTLPHKRSPDWLWWWTSNYSFIVLLVHRPWKDERLSQPHLQSCNGRFTQISGESISCRSMEGRGKFASQRPAFYCCATRPQTSQLSNVTICISPQLKRRHTTYLSQRCSLSISFWEGTVCSTCASDLTASTFLFVSCFASGPLSWPTACGSHNVSMPCIWAADCWIEPTSLFSSSSFCLTATSRLQIKLIHWVCYDIHS